MSKGFLSFALYAVFLLSIFSAGVLLSRASPDYSYESYRSSFVQEIAIKRAFYSAISQAASDALAVSEKADPREKINSAVLARAADFAGQLSAQGYDVIFWCGESDEGQRQQASRLMKERQAAIAPEGTLLLEDCKNAIDSDPLERKLHLFGMGFSIYHRELGVREAAVFPSSYEVDF